MVTGAADNTRYLPHWPSVRELLEEAPEAFEQNLRTITEIPGMKGAVSDLQALGVEAAEKRAEEVIGRMKENLVWLYKKLEAYEPKDKNGNPVLDADGKPINGVTLLKRAILWYEGGNRTAAYWAKKYALRTRQTAGVIAVYSPQTGWFINLSRAERTMDIWRVFYNTDISQIKVLRKLEDGSTVEETAESMLDKLYDEAATNARAAAKKTVRKREEDIAKGEKLAHLDLAAVENQLIGELEWMRRRDGRTLGEIIGKARKITDRRRAIKAEEDALTVEIDRLTPIVEELEAKCKSEKVKGLRTPEAKAARAARDAEKAKKTAARNRKSELKKLRESLEPEETVLWQEAGKIVRAIDEVVNTRRYRVQKPEGGSGGWAKRKGGDVDDTFVWANYGQIGKALQILEDDNPEVLYEALGNEFKVRDFFNNLYRPSNDRAATIDTHQVGANTLSVMSSSDDAVNQNFGSKGVSNPGFTSQRGTYAFHFEALRLAGKEFGLIPREMQSATWEAIRSLFPDYMKDKEFRKAVASIWAKHDADPKNFTADMAREEIFKLAGGFHGFAWMTEKFLPEGDPRIVYDTYERGHYDAQIEKLGLEQPRPEPVLNLEAAVGKERLKEWRKEHGVPKEGEERRGLEKLAWLWDRLDEEDKGWVTSELVPWLVKRVSASLRTYIGEARPQLGGWEGELNSSYAARVTGGGDYSLIGRLAATYSWQDGIYAISDTPAAGVTRGKAITIDLPDGFKKEQVADLYNNYIKKINGPNGKPIGMSSMDGTILIGVGDEWVDRIEEGLRRELERHPAKLEVSRAETFNGTLLPFSEKEIKDAGRSNQLGREGKETGAAWYDPDLQAAYDDRFAALCFEANRRKDRLTAEELADPGKAGYRENLRYEHEPPGYKGFLQRAGDRKGVKGAYRPDIGQIKFTRFADLSTFAHEHAHHYLNCLMKFGINSRYDYIRDDIRTLLDLWHIGDGSMTLEERLKIWDGLGVEGQRKFHEQFASHFEIYLSEGRAPTKGLAGVFQRIGEWLRALYHNAVAKEVGERYRSEIGEDLPGLSDEVRTVLGHMFQAQDEAAAARPAIRVPQSAVAAARVLQTEEATDQKAAAPLAGPEDPLSVAAGRQALMKAVDDINSGRPVDVSRELDDVPMNEKALTAFRKQLDRKVIEWKSEFSYTPKPGLLGNMIGPVDENVARSVAGNPDPEALGFSRTGTVADGAPMVVFGSIPEKTQGTASFIWVDGRKVPVVYAVVEAGRPRLPGRPGYGQKTKVVHAVAKASELAGLRDAYVNGTAGKYRSYLEEKLAPALGINTAAVKAMKRPALVRWLPEDVLEPAFLRKVAQPQESPYGPPEPNPLATFQLVDPRVKAPEASYVKISPKTAAAVEKLQEREYRERLDRALGPRPYLDSIPADYRMLGGEAHPGAAPGAAAENAGRAPVPDDAGTSPAVNPETPAGTPEGSSTGMETAGRAPVPDTARTLPTVNPEAPEGTPGTAPPPRTETPPAGIDPAAIDVKRERAAMVAGDRADAARVATIIESDPKRVVALEDEDGRTYELSLADVAGEQDGILERARKSALARLEGVTCMLRNGGLG